MCEMRIIVTDDPVACMDVCHSVCHVDDCSATASIRQMAHDTAVRTFLYRHFFFIYLNVSFCFSADFSFERLVLLCPAKFEFLV